MMVEKQLAAEGRTTRGRSLGARRSSERVWDWKRQYGGAITEQMRRLGASVDWSREYFTMDAGLSAAVVEAFVRLYEQGLIYRGAYIVNWDPALADGGVGPGGGVGRARGQAVSGSLSAGRWYRIDRDCDDAAGDHAG